MPPAGLTKMKTVTLLTIKIKTVQFLEKNLGFTTLISSFSHIKRILSYFDTKN